MVSSRPIFRWNWDWTPCGEADARESYPSQRPVRHPARRSERSMTRPTWRELLVAHSPDLFIRISPRRPFSSAYPNCGDGWQQLVTQSVVRVSAGADTPPGSGNDDLPWQQGNSRPRTEALTHPVRLRAGTTALRRFVQ